MKGRYGWLLLVLFVAGWDLVRDFLTTDVALWNKIIAIPNAAIQRTGNQTSSAMATMDQPSAQIT